MKVFTYNGSVDTVMTPLDSVLYNKHFLRTGFMAMDPLNGFRRVAASSILRSLGYLAEIYAYVRPT